MRLLDELRAEHELIDRTLGALRTYVARRVAGSSDAGDAAAFLRFFRDWAGHWHHAREEEVLFAALVAQVSLPADRGPIAALGADHRRLATLLDEMAPLLEGPLGEASERARLEDLAVSYSRALWLHIDAESSVLFPESEQRLTRAGIHELDDRRPSPDDLAARDGVSSLVERYPATRDPHVVRGEGCAVCPSFGSPCEGIEREWWSDAEWDELADHVG